MGNKINKMNKLKKTYIKIQNKTTIGKIYIYILKEKKKKKKKGREEKKGKYKFRRESNSRHFVAIASSEDIRRIGRLLKNKEALTVLCSIVKHVGSACARREVYGGKRDVVECFSLLLRNSSHSQVLYNRAQSRLLYCLFYDKESVKFPRIATNFIFRECRPNGLHSHKTWLNKPPIFFRIAK